MSAFYNENDPQKAAWLRELIRQDVIAPGEVDERSVTEIEPADLHRFTQCHFFAGIGVWSYALRLAGWPDDRPVWTGSCPCPSFSCAGKGRGFDDPRHLWPAWYRLIPESNPPTIFGEQADDAIGYGWLDLVQTDLERASYAVGKAVLGACSVGSPHIRQRLYFCAHAASSRQARPENGRAAGSNAPAWSRSSESKRNCDALVGPHSESGRLQQHDAAERYVRKSDKRCEFSFGANADGGNSSNGGVQRCGQQRLLTEDCGTGQHSNTSASRLSVRELKDLLGARRRSEGRTVTEPGPTSGFWSDCDWWYGRDGKYRPIEPGLFPLAHGVANRVLKLRGFGDAIVPQVAAEFIGAYRELFQ